jgi:hypothetical protein
MAKSGTICPFAMVSPGFAALNPGYEAPTDFGTIAQPLASQTKARITQSLPPFV